MTEKAIVSCQIPQDWKVKIDRLAAERKKESSQLIYEALAQYLGEDVNRNDRRLNAVEVEVTTLRNSVSQLELIVKGLQQRSPVFSTSSNASAASVEPFDDDDLIEEPDEILIDFLPPEER